MKFYRLSEVPRYADEQVFKRSPFGAGIALVVISAIAIAALLLGLFHVDGITVPPFIFYIVAGTAVLFGLFAAHSFRASLQPSNWLLRCHQSGILIHFRSYLNWKIPSDEPEVVGFDYAEIATAKIVKEKRLSPGLGNDRNTQVQWLTFLHLTLRNPDTTDLETEFQRGTNLKANGIMISHDYPVQLQPGDIVELRWSGGIKPSVRKAIDCLRQHVKIVEAESRKTDLTHKRDSKPEEEDGKILELARRGDEFGAIKLTRMVHGCSLSEAKDFVEQLKSGRGDSSVLK